MRKAFLSCFFLVLLLSIFVPISFAQTATPFPRRSPAPTVSPSQTATATPTATPTPEPVRVDLTQETQTTVEPLKKILQEQEVVDIWPANHLKFAIRNAVEVGVPPNTIVLLLLLPGVAAIIAAARHLVGVRGFGILMPAALSVVFVALGPVVGIGIFLVIVLSSMFARFVLRRTNLKLQYLPRMALILLAVVAGILSVLFLAPVFKYRDFVNVSIFPVLFLVLLAEDFTRVQLGKSFRVAVSLTIETLALSLVSYLFLIHRDVQTFVLLNPELYLLSVIVFDLLMGKYVGLRFIEFWRFRKLIRS